MSEKHEVLKAVKAAFEQELRINLHRHPIQMDFEDGLLTLEGEVEDIAAKKLGLELAIVIPGVKGIVDRLHVTPAVPMGDGEVLHAVRDAFLEEPALRECSIRVPHKGKEETIRNALSPNPGVIELSVNNGVVLLDDHVPSLARKRLAGVLGWWVAGSRDVINGMAVEPPGEDNENEISELVRVVLKKNPLVQAQQISVSTQNSVVTLEGLVRNERE